METDKDVEITKAQSTSSEERLEPPQGTQKAEERKSLEERHNELVRQVDRLSGASSVINIVFSVASLVLLIGGALGLWNLLRYQQFEATREEAFEVLVTDFEEKIADTIDRISFFDPNDEQEYKVVEMVKMQDQLRHLGISNPRFELRSDLADAIQLVIHNESEQARSKLRQIERRAAGRDSFIEARALTLDAIAIIRDIPERECVNPEIRTKVVQALKLDSNIGAAYNLLGACEANETRLKAKDSAADPQSIIKDFESAFVYYELSYHLKPIAMSRARYINNEITDYDSFLNEVLNRNGGKASDVDKALSASYKSAVEFAVYASRELKRCQALAPDSKKVYLATEAELNGLMFHYYHSSGNEAEANKAAWNRKDLLVKAIDEGLLKNEHSYEKAIALLKGDQLLSDLSADKDIQVHVRNTVWKN